MKRMHSLPVAIMLLAGCGDGAVPLSGPEAMARSRAAVGSDLGTLGGASSFASDINDAGTVVGWSATAEGHIHAFRWNAATRMSDLGTLPGGSESGAVRVLNSGQILGWSRLRSGRRVTVQWNSDGRIRALSIPTLREVFGMDPSDFNQRG